MIVEICANSIQSALNALAGGATRIELCQNLEKGGITPTIAEIHTACSQMPLDVMVLVRLRFGDFHYSNKFWRQLEMNSITSCHMGAKGIVTGMLDRDGNVEVDLLKHLVGVLRENGMDVTFHRAFDRCRDWHTAMEQIIDCGFTRILTSGQAKTAEKGIPTLAQMVRQADGRIKIMAGGGITSANARRIADLTGVDEIHASCKINIGGTFVTNTLEVQRLIKAVNT